MFKPDKVNIFGKVYPIQYCDNPSDVDIYKRKAVWGNVDFWTRTIRIYDNNRSDGDILDGIIHEILHVITVELKIDTIVDSADEEEIISLIAIALADTFSRNGWINENTG